MKTFKDDDSNARVEMRTEPMTPDELTDRAARWCEAAGIPPPYAIYEREPGIEMVWTLGPHGAWIEARCKWDGSLYWHDNYSCMSYSRSSARLIAAIKEVMDA